MNTPSLEELLADYPIRFDTPVAAEGQGLIVSYDDRTEAE